MKLIEKNFILYKLFNSSFTGLSIGILFTIYEPLKPLVYSVGGMILALSMLIIANFYEKLLNIKSFFKVTIFVEVVMLLTIVAFMVLGYSLYSAMLIYCGYQLTFIFGGYLVRAETLVANDKELISNIDIAKHFGYLVGLGCSSVFYMLMDQAFDVPDSKDQITILHYLLIVLQSVIIILALSSFKRDDEAVS